MKPILILQHLSSDGPGYFGVWLQRQGVPFVVRNTEAGQAFPADMGDHAALAVLGGEMSANDPLPSLRRAEDLIRDAIAAGKPVIGHCLGGQLMARALGAAVHPLPAPEVGWQPIEVLPRAAARHWFGSNPQPTVFQWHYEAFELPAGADALARSAACPHQAYALGPHLGMQFHIEVDAAKVEHWSREPGALDAVLHHPTVQDGATMRSGLQTHLAAHQALADQLYGVWLASVARA
jgi:GMP synthase-like glutamine amidotransferase